MAKEYDIIGLGECLVDFVANRSTDGKRIILEGNAGGAPANVLACAARLGLKTAFIGKLGMDSFGYFVRDAISEAGVDTGSIVFTKQHPTTVAIVNLDDSGNRSFSFYRDCTADVMLEKEELDYKLIASGDVFHFGSVSMTAEPSRTATLAAAEYAKRQGLMVSYDPNLRKLLWDSEEEAREVLLRGVRLADIVKVSDEELVFLTGETKLEEAALKMAAHYGIKLLAVTMGSAGSMCCVNGIINRFPAYSVKTVDTTGAGDAYFGAVLSFILKKGIPVQQYSKADIDYMVHFANAAGSLATAKQGAIPAMPTEEQILTCMEQTVYLIK